MDNSEPQPLFVTPENEDVLYEIFLWLTQKDWINILVTCKLFNKAGA